MTGRTHSAMARLRMAAISMLMAISGLLIGSVEPAAAAINRPLLLPFAAGETWCVYHGYLTGAGRHDGYELDIVYGSACSGETSSGKSVRTPWSGYVWHVWTEGVCVNITGGGSFSIGHIVPAVADNTSIGLHKVLGTIREAPWGDNPTNIEHAHMEVFGGTNCSGSNTPFADSARMQCAPNMTATGGGYNNGYWGKEVITRPSDATAKAGTPFWDICNESSGRKTAIKWIYDQGITSGCDADRFCPDGIVTRGQIASFLKRYLSLPNATRDYFTDDEQSIHEGAINSIAEAGITGGCGGTNYCPEGLVARDQMASFLARGLDLPAATRDYFTDDEGNKHEGAINAIAAAGITGGCGGTNYCPSGLVTRSQMAAFLYNGADER